MVCHTKATVESAEIVFQDHAVNNLTKAPLRTQSIAESHLCAISAVALRHA